MLLDINLVDDFFVYDTNSKDKKKAKINKRYNQPKMLLYSKGNHQQN